MGADSRAERFASWFALALGWVALAAIIDPAGDFPLNDDWAYGRVVESLHRLGTLQFPGEVAVSLIAHAWWGLAFTEVFGFSFTVLRLSTWVAALAGLIVSFELFRALKLARSTVWLGTACIALNPIFLSLSYTFMSDISFYTWFTAALLSYVTYLERRHARYLAIALVCSLLAVLTRDVGIVVPLAFAMAARVRRADGTITPRWLALAPLLLCAVTLAAYQAWLVTTDRMPVAYGLHARRLATIGWTPLFQTLARSARAMVSYLGLFLVPVLLPLAASRLRTATWPQRRRMYFLAAGIVLALGIWAVSWRSLMPFADNIVGRATVGPVVLPAASTFLKLGAPGVTFWAVVTLVAIAGAALVIVLAVGAHPRGAREPLALVAIVAGLYGGSLCFTWIVDRYFLPLLPLAVVLTCRPGEHAVEVRRLRSWLLSLPLLLAMASLAVAGTHDYLAWNRARWDLAREFLAREAPGRLDGGLEIDAWFAYPLDRPFVHDRSWWWVARKPYAIALGPLPGFETVARRPVHTWLPFAGGFIYLLRRT